MVEAASSRAAVPDQSEKTRFHSVADLADTIGKQRTPDHQVVRTDRTTLGFSDTIRDKPAAIWSETTDSMPCGSVLKVSKAKKTWSRMSSFKSKVMSVYQLHGV